MKLSRIKIALLSCLFLTLVYSCANDDDIVSTSNTDIIENPVVVSNSTTQVIADWNALWIDIDRYTDAMRPNTTARALAYIHLAGYETAVSDMDGYTPNENRLPDFTIDFGEREDNVILDLALTRCYALVIDHFMFSVTNNAKAGIEALYEQKVEELSVNLTPSEIENLVDWGTYVASRVIAYSQTDLNAESQVLDPNPTTYMAPVGVGLWVAAEGESAWFPYWNSVRTFVISPEETSSIAPTFDYDVSPDSECFFKYERSKSYC